MVESPVDVKRLMLSRFFLSYPNEAASHLADLPPEEILQLLREEPVSVASRILLRLNPEVAVEVIKKSDDDFFQKIFYSMDPFRGALLLSRFDSGQRDTRLSLLPKPLEREYRELMSYRPDSAGQLMDPRVLTFFKNDTVEQVLRRIRAVDDRRIYDVCVVDEDRTLVGVVALQVIAVSDPGQRLSELVYRDPVTVNMMDPREDVVNLMEERRLASLPVVNIEGKLVGIIRQDALVTAAQEEATLDLQAMFGAGRDERALSKVSFAIRKRLPWLEINLATAFLAATVVGLFEDTIAQVTALAVFLPVVAGQSGNTGSQALAVTMRGLALREIRSRHWLKVGMKEISVGFFNGLAVALTTSLVVYLWMSSFALAAVIGAAMVLSMVIAGMSGALIPIILQSMGQDPAQSSSIVLTTITDVVGFLSFLGLASIFADMIQI